MECREAQFGIRNNLDPHCYHKVNRDFFFISISVASLKSQKVKKTALWEIYTLFFLPSSHLTLLTTISTSSFVPFFACRFLGYSKRLKVKPYLRGCYLYPSFLSRCRSSQRTVSCKFSYLLELSLKTSSCFFILSISLS